MNLKFSSLALTLALVLPCGSVLAAAAGQVTLLTGRATSASSDGTIRNLDKGSPVFSREFISTGSNSFVNIKFADGGAILIKPNSRFHIEQFTYPKAEKKNRNAAPANPATQRATASRAFFSLLKGGFRAVSGLIGKTDRNEYRVTTPVATIGIRGTDYEAILCDDACASDPMIMEKIGVTTNPQDGLVASVVHGGIGVTTIGTAQVSSLRTYRALMQALNLAPAGLVKTAYRPSLFKVANTDPNTYTVEQGQVFFFPKIPGQPPIKLPGMSPNIDNGLKDYSPKDICK